MSDPLRIGQFLLSELPDDASPSIWVLTDGVVRVPSADTFDSLPMILNRFFLINFLNLIRERISNLTTLSNREGIVCDIILVGAGYNSFNTFGYIPSLEELEVFCGVMSGQMVLSNEVLAMASGASEVPSSLLQRGSLFILRIPSIPCQKIRTRLKRKSA